MIQHEMDHLDGVLILDRTSRDQRKQAMRALREALEPRRRRVARALRNVYLGTSDFAAVVLRRLAGSPHAPRSSSPGPTRPRGRGRKRRPPPVAVAARGARASPCIQPERLHDAGGAAPGSPTGGPRC